MPMYLYNCQQCGHQFEKLRGMNDKDNDVECPQCRAKEPVRILMPFNHNLKWPGNAFRIG